MQGMLGHLGAPTRFKTNIQPSSEREQPSLASATSSAFSGVDVCSYRTSMSSLASGHIVCRGSAQPEDIRAALAVALAERKDATKASEIGWKRKAMVARTTLLRLSKSMKKLESSQASGSAVSSALLHELQVDLDAWESQAGIQSGQAPSASTVREQSCHLQSFMDAIEVCEMNADRCLQPWRLYT